MSMQSGSNFEGIQLINSYLPCYRESFERRKKRPSTLRLRLSPLAELGLADAAQQVDGSDIALGHALGDLDRAAEDALARERVAGRLGLDGDHADARVLGPAVVHAVLEVADPGLERGRVPALDQAAVRRDGALAADGRPLARRRQEGHVHVRVRRQVRRLAAVGVDVEEERGAVVLLVISVRMRAREWGTRGDVPCRPEPWRGMRGGPRG
jgi:hypothetical protein